MLKYPVITLWQPWASWIAEGWKNIETRTHSKFSCLVGKQILIHAGMQWDKDAFRLASDYLTPEQLNLRVDALKSRGFILCLARVIGHFICTKADEQRALIECQSVRRYGLWLSDIKKIEPPILAKGKQGIWYYTSEREL